MKKLSIKSLQIIKRSYDIIYPKLKNKPKCDLDPDSVSQKISSVLKQPEGAMIARFGANELNCLDNYLAIENEHPKFKKITDYLTGKSNCFWWNEGIKDALCTNAGFFPNQEKKIEEYCRLQLQDIEELDILGSWLSNEIKLSQKLEHVTKVQRIIMEPFWSTNPWTHTLKNKKVLVIHPFKESIEKQYKIKNKIFPHNLLPDFELITLKAVQSAALENTQFKDWFDALNYMKAQMNDIDYDVCLIGAGAYGFHLAAHAKRMGKKGFHIGGSLQLLFGIRGKRWDNPNYNPIYKYTHLFNDYWQRPIKTETPKLSKKIEDSCYW